MISACVLALRRENRGAGGVSGECASIRGAKGGESGSRIRLGAARPGPARLTQPSGPASASIVLFIAPLIRRLAPRHAIFVASRLISLFVSVPVPVAVVAQTIALRFSTYCDCAPSHSAPPIFYSCFCQRLPPLRQYSRLRHWAHLLVN